MMANSRYNSASMTRHESIDQRSVALGRAIAVRLEAEPELMEMASANLDRWEKTCSSGVKPALVEWRSALERGRESVMALLTGDDERAKRLRQSNPFAGLIPQRQRNDIFKRFAPNDQAST